MWKYSLYSSSLKLLKRLLLTILRLEQHPQLLLAWQGILFPRVLSALDCGIFNWNSCSVSRKHSTVAFECEIVWNFVGVLQTCVFQISVDGLPYQRKKVRWEFRTWMQFKLLHGVHQCDRTWVVTNRELEIVFVQLCHVTRYKFRNLPWKFWFAGKQWDYQCTKESSRSPSFLEGDY